MSVDIGTGGEQGVQNGEVLPLGRGLEKSLHFFEKYSIEDSVFSRPAKDGVNFVSFCGVSRRSCEQIEATVKGIVIGFALFEEELE